MPGRPAPFSLYPRNASPALDDALFRRPTAEYRGAPFWSWNNAIDVPQLLRHLDGLAEMGFGGVNIHPRTGLATEYLGPAYMDAIAACVEHAKSRGMLVWLYDEDRWPSGFAGGIVTRDPRFRAKRLLWTCRTYEGDGEQLGRYSVELTDGRLSFYSRLEEDERPGGNATLWVAYLETTPPEPWFNGQANVDVMSRPAIERFLAVTHDRYAARVGKHFGHTIPAIFTDEPQFPRKQHLANAADRDDVVLPWSGDFADTFYQAYGQDLLDHLPELFWNLPGDAPSLARYRYHDHTAERFATAFGDVIGDWCKRHRIALTGHMLGETRLFSQVRGCGEAMRGLRAFQLPGIDVLEDKAEYTTAKQAQSVARQYGRPAVLSELYGVTNWDFDFVGHKAQGDWQAAMGVAVRVPHLTWVSMAGEAKRDYPASIGYQSPWSREYPVVEDHFARVATVMTRGEPRVRVAVVHPIESFFLCFGPAEQNGAEMAQQEAAFAALPRWLAHGLIDFDYISEALLPTQASAASARRPGRSPAPPPTSGQDGGGGRTAPAAAISTSAMRAQAPAIDAAPTFDVGLMRYEAVVVPNLRTIRSTTLRRLEAFADAGGTVVFAGVVPAWVDAEPSPAAAELAARCSSINFDRDELLSALSPFRDVDATLDGGSRPDSLLYALRAEGDSMHAFFCNADRAAAKPARLRLRGGWNAEHLDTTTGDRRPLRTERGGGEFTVIPWTFAPHGHLLVTLTPGPPIDVAPVRTAARVETAHLDGPVPVTLSEPNVLMLDQPAWRIDGGDWQPPEEALRLTNVIRARLGLPPLSGRIAQPWADVEPTPALATVQLRYTLRCEVRVESPLLAVEDPASLSIALDGQPVPPTDAGWWTDEAIRTIALPALAPGEHALTIALTFTRKISLEWCYLLGDFGVRLAGRDAAITAPVRRLAWGDWTTQGLPFYGGNVTYHAPLAGTGRPTTLAFPQFKAPLLSIDIGGRSAGKVAFAPFEVDFGPLEKDREHAVAITAYGNRVNCFGAVHNANPNTTWWGPTAWRTTGESWSYEYSLKPMGVLLAPITETETYFCTRNEQANKESQQRS